MAGIDNGLSFFGVVDIDPIFALRTFFARGGELERVTLRSVAVFFSSHGLASQYSMSLIPGCFWDLYGSGWGYRDNSGTGK